MAQKPEVKKFSYLDLTHLPKTGHARFKLDFNEVCSFIPAVVSAVVSQTGRYAPYIKDVAFFNTLCDLYTDVRFETLDEAYCYLRETDLMQTILEVIDNDQIAFIQASIDECIKEEKSRSLTERALAQLPSLLERLIAADVLKSVAPTMERGVKTDSVQ